jgi:hypothetical protein
MLTAQQAKERSDANREVAIELAVDRLSDAIETAVSLGRYTVSYEGDYVKEIGAQFNAAGYQVMYSKIALTISWY